MKTICKPCKVPLKTWGEKQAHASCVSSLPVKEVQHTPTPDEIVEMLKAVRGTKALELDEKIYICSAVNAHEALVNALQSANDTLMQILAYVEFGNPANKEDARKTLAYIQKTLSQAEENKVYRVE